MTTVERLKQIAAKLTDDQLDGLLAYATDLAGEPLSHSVPTEVVASIERGVDQQRTGNTQPAADVFDTTVGTSLPIRKPEDSTLHTRH